MSIDESDIPALARGCAVLGTGGGGDVRTGSLAAVGAVREHGEVPLIGLDELDDDALIVPLSGIGAPTVSHEMIHSADEPKRIAEEIERLFGRPPSAIMSSEIGGSNGVAPVAWAARLGLPLLDADGMGRAFPEVQMVSMYVAGLPADLVIMSDIVGNVVTIRPVDGLWSERLARAVCVAAGSSALMADYVLTTVRARGAVIEGTVTRAIEIGRATEGAADPLGALQGSLGAVRLITGKLTDVERRTTGGFVRGTATIEGTGDDRAAASPWSCRTRTWSPWRTAGCGPWCPTSSPSWTPRRPPPCRPRGSGTASASRCSPGRATRSGAPPRAWRRPGRGPSATTWTTFPSRS